MRREISVREFIQNYEAGKYNDPDKMTMIAAGWYDWFCEDDELKPRLDAMFPRVKQLAQSEKIDTDRMYVWFKNNRPGRGSLYDDFRFGEIETGDVVYIVIHASGQRRNKGRAELWGRENDFNEALAEGTWTDIETFFLPLVR